MTYTVQSLDFVGTLRLDASGRFVLSASRSLAWTVGRAWTEVRANLEQRKRFTVTQQ